MRVLATLGDFNAGLFVIFVFFCQNMDLCNANGHILGMLDRDQRTAKWCHIPRQGETRITNREGFPQNAHTLTNHHSNARHQRALPRRASPHSSCKTRKAQGYFWKSLQRKWKSWYNRLIFVTIGGAINRWPIARHNSIKLFNRPHHYIRFL